MIGILIGMRRRGILRKIERRRRKSMKKMIKSMKEKRSIEKGKRNIKKISMVETIDIRNPNIRKMRRNGRKIGVDEGFYTVCAQGEYFMLISCVISNEKIK